MSLLGKKIIKRCCGVVLSMSLLCGCSAQEDVTANVSESVDASTEVFDMTSGKSR